MGIFWSFLKPYKKEAFLAPLFKWFEALTQLVVPLFIARIIDQGIRQEQVHIIIYQGGLLLLFAVLGVFFSVIAQAFSARTALSFASAIRLALFQHINNLSLEERRSFTPASLVTRLNNDINQMQTGLNMFLRLFLRSPFLVLGTIFACYQIHPQTGLSFFILSCLLLTLIFALLASTLPFYEKVQAKLDRLTSLATDSLSGVRVLRSFGQEKKQADAFKLSQSKLTNIQFHLSQINALLNPSSYLLLNAGLLLLLYRSGFLVDQGHMTQGQVVAIVNYLSQLLIELMKIVTCVMGIARGISASKRVKEVLTSQASPNSNQPSERSLLEEDFHTITFEKVSYSYTASSQPALHQVSFSLKAGQSVGIIGGTGAGKSTIAHLLANLLHPTSGKILINGHDLSHYHPKSLSHYTSIVLQKSVLFQGILAEQLHVTKEDLLLNKEDRLTRAFSALKAAAADSFIPLTIDGLKLPVSQSGKNFSGGQRQRLSIARSLCQEKPILILDDALSALDYKTASQVNSRLQQWPSKKLIIRISQRLQVIEDSDIILVMDHGQLIASGRHEDLLATCPLYQEIYASQHRKEMSYA